MTPDTPEIKINSVAINDAARSIARLINAKDLFIHEWIILLAQVLKTAAASTSHPETFVGAVHAATTDAMKRKSPTQ